MDIREILHQLGDQTIRFSGSSLIVGDTKLMVLLNYLYPGLWLDSLDILDDKSLEIEHFVCNYKRSRDGGVYNVLERDESELDSEEQGELEEELEEELADELELKLEGGSRNKVETNSGASSSSSRTTSGINNPFFFRVQDQICNPVAWTCSCSTYLHSLYHFQRPGCPHLVAVYLMTEVPCTWSKRAYKTTALRPKEFFTKRLEKRK